MKHDRLFPSHPYRRPTEVVKKEESSKATEITGSLMSDEVGDDGVKLTSAASAKYFGGFTLAVILAVLAGMAYSYFR